MKSLLVGTGCYLCKVYNYHDSRACGYKWSRILSRLNGLGMEWLNMVFGIALWNRVLLCRSYFVIF
jgi:hypothetical protein